MKKRFLLAVPILVLAVLAALLWPQDQNLEKYQRALERGQYDQVISGLQKGLARNPGWKEARELVFSAAMSLGRIDLAWEQVLALHEQDEPTEKFQSQLQDFLMSTKLDPHWLNNTLELGRRYFEANGFWEWGLKFHLQLLFTTGEKEEMQRLAFQFLEDLASGSDDSRSILLSIRDFLARDLGQAWAISDRLDFYGNGGESHRHNILLGLDEAARDSLQAQFPQDGLLAVSHATMMEPARGLEYLRVWEKTNGVRRQDQEYYYVTKLGLLAASDVLHEEDLGG